MGYTGKDSSTQRTLRLEKIKPWCARIGDKVKPYCRRRALTPFHEQELPSAGHLIRYADRIGGIGRAVEMWISAPSTVDDRTIPPAFFNSATRLARLAVSVGKNEKLTLVGRRQRLHHLCADPRQLSKRQ